ncbi:prolyl oligopeptidase family serine peptidase [Alicyclobacillus ferrooxydans]|uniref:prolyl oligopeptidase n=1 Tax=Alicyclobacillus ferrooxydans TaxID=471514 RepID=A0A0N8PP48_9BACL|nr:prolyl oligopeptidase family serine peptidase [Alicyclobacillus ferrooxydans]KPV43325.1 prolyl endopeptidase [Alicyclobacillus ferrooxydans]
MTDKTSRAVPVENFHGVLVADPFRWLEDPMSDETKEFVRNQNVQTREVLDALTVRHSIRKRLETLWRLPQYFTPVKAAGRLFFLQNDGQKNQPALYVVDADQAGDTPRLLVDPNQMSDNGTVALTQYSVRRDGTKVAYATAKGGSDWQIIRVVDVESGENETDFIQWCKFTTPAWHPDGSGFFYTRFPERDESGVADQSQNAAVYFHVLGTDQSADELVYARPDAPELGFYPHVSHDGKYLFLHVTKGTDRETRLYVRELEGSGEWQRVLDKGDAKYSLLGNEGSRVYIQTDLDAPKGRIVSFDLRSPEPEHWTEVVAEQDLPLTYADFAKDALLLLYLQDAHHVMKVRQLSSGDDYEVELPTVGSITGLFCSQRDEDAYFGLTSFLYPVSVFHLNIATGAVSSVWDASAAFDVSPYVTKQVFYESKDGTKVPMFLTHRRDLALNSDNPVLITGYGGFNISRTPAFSPAALQFVEQGGVYALANLRGGSEYGEAWHRAGMLENKQNVFDDFQSAAEYLIREGYTRPERTAIIGGSNGGLLVAACMLQRPDLYGAVVCQVPVIDMLRYHRFTVGRYWVGEYGNAEENKEQFEFMYEYSPLHNVVQGRVYPPILITTADSDDRVVPSHPYKFTATLQAASPGVNPILLRVETEAGHGAGKPISKLIDEQTDIYAFLADTIGSGKVSE